MEKHGFVYIWMDRYRKMFYIGSHWGSENDGYICSSNRMRDAHRRRPHDFKRRILWKGLTTRKNLLETEQYWLNLIKSYELKIRYYNAIKNVLQAPWQTNGSSSPMKGKSHTNKSKEKNRLAHLGKRASEQTKEKLRAAHLGERNHFYGKSHSEETKDLQRGANNHMFIPLEVKEKRKQRKQENLEKSWFSKGSEPWNKNRQMDDKYKKNIKEHSNRELMKEISLARPKVTCPHCNKEGQKNVMLRWHFDNCRLKDA